MGGELNRRQVITAGGIGVAGALPGCTSSPSGTDGTGEGTHTVSMEPMGEVGFSSVPETFVGRFGFVVDIVAALDELDSLVAMYSNYSVFGHSHFYDELETVSIDPTEIEEFQTDDWDIRLERLYELAPDFTAIDPNYLIHYTQFDEDEVDQFINRVGPFLHNESQRINGSVEILLFSDFHANQRYTTRADWLLSVSVGLRTVGRQRVGERTSLYQVESTGGAGRVPSGLDLEGVNRTSDHRPVQGLYHPI
ncbi:hypothetical protein [Natrinema saccharevitans]|uniref:hypothetical protein n=1 Tax=Natrinema saccharevitans TaxID=301967 RepID=UPI001FEA3309|nr:hypothetical protein [Natrinema saccharevitans]